MKNSVRRFSTFSPRSAARNISQNDSAISFGLLVITVASGTSFSWMSSQLNTARSFPVLILRFRQTEYSSRIAPPGTISDSGILEDVFLGVDPDRPYDILANSRDGLAAISIGDAVFKSITEERIVDLTEVMKH